MKVTRSASSNAGCVYERVQLSQNIHAGPSTEAEEGDYVYACTRTPVSDYHRYETISKGESGKPTMAQSDASRPMARPKLPESDQSSGGGSSREFYYSVSPASPSSHEFSTQISRSQSVTGRDHGSDVGTPVIPPRHRNPFHSVPSRRRQPVPPPPNQPANPYQSLENVQDRAAHTVPPDGGWSVEEPSQVQSSVQDVSEPLFQSHEPPAAPGSDADKPRVLPRQYNKPVDRGHSLRRPPPPLPDPIYDLEISVERDRQAAAEDLAIRSGGGWSMEDTSLQPSAVVRDLPIEDALEQSFQSHGSVSLSDESDYEYEEATAVEQLHVAVEDPVMRWSDGGGPVQETAAAIGDLSVEDVADCLRKLRLDAFVDAFQRQGVDGALLAHIDEQMLTSDFAMSRFEAKKLLMYVKQGWRPKSSDSR